MEAIRHHDMVVAIGPAGTGKTFVAATYAVEELIAKRIERIILTRPTVCERGEEIGFLPGSADKKLEPWTAPIFDVFDDRLGKATVKQLVGEGRIRIEPLTFMRGRTFRNAIILADEVQNMTRSQAKKLVTRAGEGAKLILSGDLEQTDVPGRTGLDEIVDMIEKFRLPVPLIEFDSSDCVRSPLCRMWVDAYDRLEDAA